MKCIFVVLSIYVLVLFIYVDGKRTFGGGRSKSSNKNKYRPPPPPPPPPPQTPKKTDVNRFLDSERQPSQNNKFSNYGNQQKPPPIGFDNVNQGSNNRPIGFEGIGNNPSSGKIGFDGVNSGNKPSAPVMPGNTNYGQNFGHQNPTNNFGQPHQNPGSNFGQSYPNQNYPNPQMGQSYPNQQGFGSPNTGFQSGQANGFPNQNFGNPYSNQGRFGQNYPQNPNNFGQSYPSQNFPGYQSHPFPGSNQGFQGFGHGYPNNYQQGFGSYGGNSFGMPGGGFFGSNSGFNSYGSGYNNYGKKSRFGFGGLPLPIPIPIPIPFGGFGGFGSNYNSYRSHSTLNNVIQRASNDSNNATSLYIINNSTVMPCSRESYSYNLYNISITTCTVLNCTAVSLKTVKVNNGALETNYGSITMCLDPTATITTNSSGSNLPTLSDTKTYWKSICEHSNLNVSQPVALNNTNVGNSTEVVSSSTTVNPQAENQKLSEPVLNIPIVNTENITLNLTSHLNTTEKPCEILNCSMVEFCMPKVEVVCDDSQGNMCNYSTSTYKSCIELKMCNSQYSPVIDREVKLYTNQSVIAKDNVLQNQIFKENVTVIAYVPPNPAAMQNNVENVPPNSAVYSSPSGVEILTSTLSPL